MANEANVYVTNAKGKGV